MLPLRSNISRPKNFRPEFLGQELVDRTKETFTYAMRPSTKAAAHSVQRQYLDFLVAQKLTTYDEVIAGRLPDHALPWILFCSWLDARSLEPSSISTYVAHIRALYRNNNQPTPPRWSLVQVFQKAIRRRRVAEGRLTPIRERRPLIQQNMMPYFIRNRHNLQMVRLYTTILVGVFAVMRSGELTVHTGLEAYSENIHIHRGKGVHLFPDYARIILPVSKTSVDRATHICVPKLPAVMAAICPYRALVNWLSLTADEPSSAHLFSINGEPYAKDTFSAQLRKTLLLCNMDPTVYSGHSLRIGGLTALREAGIDENEAMIIGRWTSEVNRIYWQRTSKDHNRIAATLSNFIITSGLPSSEPPTFQLSLVALQKLVSEENSKDH